MIEVAAIELVHLGDEWRFKGPIAFGSVPLRIDHHDEFLAERLHVVVIEGPIRQYKGRLGLPATLSVGRHHVAMPEGKLRPIGFDVAAAPEELATAIAQTNRHIGKIKARAPAIVRYDRSAHP